MFCGDSICSLTARYSSFSISSGILKYLCQSVYPPGGTPRAVSRLENIKYLHKHFQYVCGSESLGSRRVQPLPFLDLQVFSNNL